jgi:iron complex transport system substrate-binding protein
VVAAAPDMILASWCGKKVQPEKIRSRAGWEAIPAVRN